MGHQPDVVAGAPILAAWHNVIRDRTVEPFTNAAERTSQWVTPPEGAMSFLRDTDSTWFYTGSAWRPIAGSFGVSVRRNAAFTVPNNSQTTIPMDTLVGTDNGGYFAGGFITIPAGMGGLYAISGVVYFPTAVWVAPNAQLRVAGATIARDERYLQPSVQFPTEHTITMSRHWRCNAGDIIDLCAHHISGSSAAIGVTTVAAATLPASPALDCYWVAP